MSVMMIIETVTKHFCILMIVLVHLWSEQEEETDKEKKEQIWDENRKYLVRI